jgi:hypothetical protein
MIIAWIKAKKPQWGPHIMSGLGGASLIFAIGLMSIAWQALPKSEPVTVDNVQTKVRDWLDKYGYASSSLPPSADYYFGFTASARNVNITIQRPHTMFSNYLVFSSAVILNDLGTSKLPPTQSEQILRTLRIEMNRLGVSYTNLGLPLTTVTLLNKLPIASQLNEDTFIKDLDSLESADRIMAEIVVLETEKLSRPTQLASKKQ